jgi:hypothetical protein
MFIHIQREDWACSGQTTGMIRSPLVDEFLVSM